MQQLNERTQVEKSNQTFKIIRKRIPWTPSEDNEITFLVNLYGTSNWTLIASELNNKYQVSARSGKQCRERWHNHLDPLIKKDYWTEKEELILFSKHNKYGNKWSNIAKYLPGRTDNSIKNFFYSKLRKFLRKIVKEMNQEKLFTKYDIDHEKFNSDKIYHMIKKCNMAYGNITKKEIINLIIKHNNKFSSSSMSSSYAPCSKYGNHPRRLITVVLSKPRDYGFGIIDLKNKIIINDGAIIPQRDFQQASLPLSFQNNSLSESDSSSVFTFNNESRLTSSSSDISPVSAFTKFVF